MRTREQIIADCEKRYEELRAEKERQDSDPIIQRGCRSCRFCSRKGWELPEWFCNEPLVKGLGDRVTVGSWMVTEFNYGRGKHHTERRPGKLPSEIHWRFPMPCGPEKALWQPKPTLCQRIIAFLTGDAA